MSRCPFPNCHGEDLHDGDHMIGRPPRPRAPLRQVQEFCATMVNSPRCDLEEHPGAHELSHPGLARRAEGLYMDEFGYGWALCKPCREHVLANCAADLVSPKVSQPAPAVVRAIRDEQPASRGRVISFAERERGIR